MADIWRVWLTDWLTFYTSDEHGEAGRAECRQVLETRWRGGPAELVSITRIVPASQRAPDAWEYQIQLHVPNLRGEYASQADAAQLAADLGAGCEVVAKGSPRDSALHERSTRMLRA